MKNNPFAIQFIKKFNENTNNFFSDRYYPYNSPINPIKRLLKNIVFAWLNVFKRFGLSIHISNHLNDETFDYLKDNWESFQWAYGYLEDSYSRDLYIDLLLYRIQGYRRVKLPINTFNYWKNFKSVQRLYNRTAHYKELNKIGFNDLKISVGYKNIFEIFYLKQYQYNHNKVSIQPGKNDTIIDAGACYGDTALFFAYNSPEGKVHSFEFVPSNLKKFRANIRLNPDLNKNIEIIEHPLWDSSKVKVSFIDNGSGSVLDFENLKGEEVETISIDDFVEQRNIHKIDFIKMDIEGAELNALKGSYVTLNKFKPTLAIAVYHKLEHFYSIILFLQSLNLGYKFYIDHFTSTTLETILFCKA